MVERKYLGADTNCIASLGYFEYGDTVYVNITLGNGDLSLYTYYNNIWYIDQEAFDNAFTSLKNGPQFNVTEYTDNNLIGTVKTTNGTETIQTTIPYDEGWSVYVDGKKVEIFKTFDALMAFNIEGEGEHSLEFKYEPSIYKVGAIISIIGISVFIILCILDLIFYFTIIRKKHSDKYTRNDYMWVLEDFDEDHRQMLTEPEISKMTFKDHLMRIKKNIGINRIREKIATKKNKKDENDPSEGDN